MKKTILCVLLAAVLALIPFAGMAAGDPVVTLAGIDMYPGDYLANGAGAVSSTQPAGGYAYLSADGKTLTLNNFDNRGVCGTHNFAYYGSYASSLIVYGPVTLNLQGQNKLSNTYSDGEGISVNGDMTIKGTGSLDIDADWGIYNWGNYANLAITSGEITIKGRESNIVSDYITISGGNLDTTSDKNTGILSNCTTISGGVVNINAKYAIYSYEDVIISGGEVNSKGVYALIAEKELQLTGGKITVTGLNEAIKANKINCTLPIPEGVEIRRIIYASTDMMDYTEALDHFDSNQWNPQWRTFQLPAQTADPVDPAVPDDSVAPAVPTTGDNASIALWAALAVMSAAAMLLIRRRRSV